MSRSARIVAASVLSGSLLTVILWWTAAAEGLFSGSSPAVAVLTFPGDSDDRAIVSALRDGGFSDIASESVQWVFINDFGEWERVPLDEYRDRIESFDPRNDGYAERLRSLFVDGDKRFVYVGRPASLFADARGVARKFDRALGPREYELRIADTGAASPLPFVLVLAAFAFAVFFLKSAVPLVAVLAAVPLAGFNPGGLAAAGFLCAASVMYVRAFGEWARTGSPKWPVAASCPWISDFLIPGVLFSAAAVFVAFLGGVPAAVALLSVLSSVPAAAAGAACVSAWSRRRGHARFSPVALRRPAEAGLAALSVLIFPFAISAAMTASVELSRGFGSFSAVSAAPVRPDVQLGFEDYAVHMEKQGSFLTSRVMDVSSEKRYTLFSIGSDGFSAVSGQPAKGMPPPRAELPPAERFLFDGNSVPLKTTFGGIRNALVLIVAFAVSYPALRTFGSNRRRLKATAEDIDKRIAA